MFVLRVLGGLSLDSTAGPLAPGAQQRRRLSLLALLALAGHRGLSRERIQAYLWPESSADRARHALDQLVYRTRRDLGPDSIASGTTDIRLNAAIVAADVWEFDEALRTERWNVAVGLYTGPLLHGVHPGNGAELEQWIDGERTLRERDYLGALDALARSAMQRGDVGEALRCRRRQSAADPFSAAIALDTMRALDAAGDRAGAIQHARTYQHLVTMSLEIDADPAVAALGDAIAARGTQAINGTHVDVASVAVASVAVTASHPRVDPSSLPEAGEKPAVHTSIGDRLGWNKVATGTSAFVLALGILAVAIAPRREVRGPTPMNITSPRAAPTKPPGAPVDASQPRVNQTANAEARALYVRARASWEKRTKEPLEEAVVLFRQATERDPMFAAAYAGLAQSYAMLGYFGFAAGDAMFPKARAAALRAIQLDPAAGDAYAALGQALAWQHEWEEAESAYKRAIELMPGDPTAHQWYALLHAYLGRAREAASHTGHASRLDPLSVQVNNMHGMMLFYAGDVDGALRQYERTVDAEPDSAWVRRNPWVLTNFSRVAAAAGRHSLAIALVERALVVVPTHPRPLFDLAYAHAVAGLPARAREALARADSTHAHYAVYRALMHALLGERDEAFAWFDRVTEWPLPSLVTMNCEPRLSALRADARFETVRARLGMSAH